jgi:hypothetical protein
VQRVVEWPLENFPLTSDMVRPLLRMGVTLEEEVKNNRIYLVDHSVLEPLITTQMLKPGV